MTELIAFGLRKLSFNGDGVLLLYIVLIGHAIINQLNATTIPDGFKYNERNTLMVVLHLIHDTKEAWLGQNARVYHLLIVRVFLIDFINRKDLRIHF